MYIPSASSQFHDGGGACIDQGVLDLIFLGCQILDFC